MLALDSARVRAIALVCRRFSLGVGLLRHRRFCAVQRARHGGGAAACCRHSIDRADLARLLADDGFDPADSAPRGRHRMAMGVSSLGARTVVRHRVDSTAGLISGDADRFVIGSSVLTRTLRAIAIVAAFIGGLALFLVVLRYDAIRAASAL